MVSNAEQPNNHPIYSLDTGLGSAILFNEEEEKRLSLQNLTFVPTLVQLEGLWKVTFDGAVCKEGAGAGVWMQLPNGEILSYSFKFAYECTNNEAEYEALMLAIQILKVFQVCSYAGIQSWSSNNYKENIKPNIPECEATEM